MVSWLLPKSMSSGRALNLFYERIKKTLARKIRSTHSRKLLSVQDFDRKNARKDTASGIRS
jgi:hypothetical protein